MNFTLPGLVDYTVPIGEEDRKRCNAHSPEEKKRYRNRQRRNERIHESPLLRPEETISGVAKPGNDISVVIEMTVKSRRVDINVWMLGVHLGDAFRSRYDANE